MSHADQVGSGLNSLSGQAGGGAGAASVVKKKRYYSNAAAAIASRRAGQLGQVVNNDDEDLEGAPFISSSRDASEVSSSRSM
jgi:hypothetical protein